MTSKGQQEAARDATVTITQTIGPWLVQLDYPADPEHHGGPIRVTVSPDFDADPADTVGGVSQTVLRQISFATAARRYRDTRRLVPALVASGDRRNEERLARLAAQHSISERYLVQLSDVYRRLVQYGERAVTQRLAEMTGRAPETIRQHLKQARKDGLLSSYRHRAGGDLSPRAVEMLREMIAEEDDSHG